MSTTEEENPPVPNWLLKLEEQREKRLKVRLGHEAGAGAKCQKCADKCPGLDLHFWRKICKACKCGKEDHDVIDDDIYGYVQFQLLGSKPIKPKGVLVKGLAADLEWLPGGSPSDVGHYLSELPAEALPVRGSAGAKLRRQRLQRQLPPHDVDASLCHQLTPLEIKELQEYVTHVKNNCVGQGKIIRLSLFKGLQHNLNPSNPQFLSQFPSSQISTSQSVNLQPSNISNNLQNLSIRDPKQKQPLPTYTPQNHQPIIDNQNPVGITAPHNIVHPLTTLNVERHQEQFENFAPNYLNVDQSGQPDNQNDKINKLPPVNNATHPLLQNYSTLNSVKQPLREYNPNFVNPLETEVIPSTVLQPTDIKYPNPSNANNLLDLSDQTNKNLIPNPQIPIYEAQNAINPYETHQNIKSVGFIRDIEPSVEFSQQKRPQDDELKEEDDVNSNQNVPKCHSCKDLFDDGSVAISAERTTNLWHSKCFNCHKCEQPLADLVYFYHKDTDDIYCGRDYAELKGIPRCQACDELIFVKEYCLAEDKTFHVKHFCCFECDEPLAGKQYVLENNQPVCITCYENLKAEKCQDCSKTIKPDEQGVSLNNLHWHATPECFACKKCRKGLLGNKMLLRNQNLFCSDLCFKSF